MFLKIPFMCFGAMFCPASLSKLKVETSALVPFLVGLLSRVWAHRVGAWWLEPSFTAREHPG